MEVSSRLSHTRFRPPIPPNAMFVISLPQTTPYRVLLCALLAMGLSVSGCDLLGLGDGESPTPDIRTEPLPSLEGVPFDALRGGTVAFQRMHNREEDPPSGLYIIDGERERTHSHLGGTLMHGAVVSPRGEEVAFRTLTPHQSDREEQSFWDVYVVRLDGTGVRQISGFPGNTEGAPIWTPDGSRIVFPNQPSTGLGPVEIYAQSPTSSSEKRELLHTINPQGDSVSFFGGRLAVSPDRKIAFVRGGSRPDGGIELVTPSSNGPTRIYGASSDSSSWLHLAAPAWAPDGERLAFLEIDGEGDVYRKIQVRVLKPSDRSVRTVATMDVSVTGVNVSGIPNFSLCWTRTGSTIAFTRPEGTVEAGVGTAHVYAVPAAGGEVAQVTSADGVIDYNVSCP